MNRLKSKLASITCLVLLWGFFAAAVGQQIGPGVGVTANAAQRRTMDGVELYADLSYAGTDNPRQMLDLILPTNRASDRTLPVIAYIHGGAWRGGDRRSAHSRLARYVHDGRFAGVSIGYRLSQEAHWPAQIHDCKAAIRWIRANADQHGLDAERIGVWGSSAGGHLVAMLGVGDGVETLEGNLGPHAKSAVSVWR